MEREFVQTMNIWALKGHRVKVVKETANAGYKSDSEKVAELLELEKEYLIERTDVHSSSTSVYLQGFEGSFNSVNFVDVVEQSPEDSALHHDHLRYNQL